MKKVQIQNCVLYLADCFEVIDEVKDIGSVVTDPPYGMSYQSNHRKEKALKIKNDDSASFANKIIEWSIENADHSLYLFGRWDNLYNYHKPKSLITWVKNNWSMGDLHHEHARQTEVLFFYPLKNHKFPSSRPSDVVYCNRTKNEDHPTEKPVNLMMKILIWTEGKIFDPFMGSGSTGVAAARMGREFVGVEFEEKYFDLACERIDAATRQPNLFENFA